jgi:hypothetical protein
MTELQVLESLEKKYSGIPLLMNKPERDVDRGLCRCLRFITVGDDGSHNRDFFYREVYRRLRQEASKYGANFDNCFWWKIGKIGPRLKTIRAAIKTLKNEQKTV